MHRRPAQDEVDSRISTLLDEIAEARGKLDFVLESSRDQRQRFQENHARLKNILLVIHQNSDVDFSELRRRRSRPSSRIDRLTAREIQVLRLIAQGLSTKQIAEALKISFKTAVSHRSHILVKMKCHESATLVRVAMQAGLVA